ncbi:hypothetical protein LWF15_03130 [Kineosporia rhizophila]|uniref:IucA/IucC family protein n=1 Tax=Kineosporia rhizophila TaxID=84633 RepID=UPI001E30E47D|nr:hypothetical protein [Kineosporia rhizophila]
MIGALSGRDVVAPWEQDLILRLGTALLREDVAGLRSRGVLLSVSRARVAGARPERRSSIGWTRRTEPAETDFWLALNGLRMPVRAGSRERGDLVSDLVMRKPLVIQVGPIRMDPARRYSRHLGSVVRAVEAELLTSVAPELAAEFRAGFEALMVEARSAARAARLRRRRQPEVYGRLRAASQGTAPLARVSLDGTAPATALDTDFWLATESLAAQRDHPIYPLSIARVGLRPTDLPRWAPEHAPRFGMRWVSVPREQVQAGGELPNWWPETPEAEVALPVHPAMTKGQLTEAAGVSWQPLPAPRLQVRPTLSMRTVVPESDPSVHLKVPLPMRTLGRLNLRLVSQASLADGAVLTHSLGRLLQQDEQFGHSVLIADESSWLHASGHLAVLVRRWPDLADARVLPVAALTARGWDGRPLVEVLAQEFFAGDVDAFLDVYLRRLLAWQLALWLRYGIVHEAHAQNVLIAVDHQHGIRLLLRDLDSCLIDPELATAALGEAAPAGLADERLISKDPVDLAAMFVTTTLHQCVAAVLVETALALRRPVAPLLARVRPLLRELADTHRGAGDTALLTSGIIQAERLPVKRTLTAATLLPKSRTGAADVNKFYGADAPTYL